MPNMEQRVPMEIKIISIFWFSLLFKLVASDLEMLSTCFSNYTETINNRTGQLDNFAVNRQTILNNLIATSTATSLSFYNTTAGETPYKFFAIYLCRGDTEPRLCGSCVTNLTEWVISLSSNCTESVAYSDHCMIHYANHSFIGIADNRSLGFSYDKYEEKISGEYNKTMKSAIEKVIVDAWNSSELFATLEASVEGEDEKVYALAECTPDVTRGGCSGCLKEAQSDLEYGVRGRAKFAWAMHTSCQLRYDNVSFFEMKSNDSSSAPAPAPVFAVLVVVLGLFFINWVL